MLALISVIVSTYNWPEALAAVLRGLRDQDDGNFEIIVADDGSDHRTRDTIRLVCPAARHVWHPDEGFRLAEIRNRAILASKGEYVIFLDGDCIPRASFVAAHRRLAEPGWFVMGNRAMLREKMTQRVFAENMAPEDWPLPVWWWMRVTRNVNRLAPLLTLPLGAQRKRTRQTWNHAMGCNFAVWRSDLDRVDGLDTSFVGWGWEDNDLFLRLLRAGVKRKHGRYATGVIHLFHHPTYAAENYARFKAVLASERMLAVRGISKLKDAEARVGRAVDG